jgi:hypothetical protein
MRRLFCAGRLLSRLCAVSVLAALGFFAGAGATEAAVTASPSVVHFAPTPVNGLSYQLVTLTNTSATETEVLQTASAAPGYFFPTFGGTCNVVYTYVIPPGTSCTFEFGFRPSQKGPQAAFGWVVFESGEEVIVILEGTGTGGRRGPPPDRWPFSGLRVHRGTPGAP